mgnify:CR=1 FL=1
MSDTTENLPETIPFSNADIEAYARGSRRDYPQLQPDRWFQFQVMEAKTGVTKNGAYQFKLVVQPIDSKGEVANIRTFLDLSLPGLDNEGKPKANTMESYLRAVGSSVRCASRWDRDAKVSRDTDGNIVSKEQHLRNKAEYSTALFQECNIRRWKDPTIFIGERFYAPTENNVYNGKTTTRINAFAARADVPDAPVEREQFTVGS